MYFYNNERHNLSHNLGRLKKYKQGVVHYTLFIDEPLEFNLLAGGRARAVVWLH
jgi:hypothetical protein